MGSLKRFSKILKKFSEKEGKMVKKLLGIFCVLVMAVGVALAATDTADVSVTVTPGGITCTLTASPASYDFGTVDLAKSSHSATAVQLQYSGGANAVIDKTVWSITSAGTAWTLATSTTSTGRDECVFGSIVKDLRPALDEFWTYGNYTTSHSSFSLTLQDYNALKDTNGNQITMSAPSDTKNVWFRIDVPSSVSGSDQQTFTVRFRATTQ